jgi:hypothetical protein
LQANIVNVLTVILHLIQACAGGYAGVKLAIYAIGYMTKNQQRIEEAKGGMKNVVIGLVIVGGIQVIISWLQSSLKF